MVKGKGEREKDTWFLIRNKEQHTLCVCVCTLEGVFGGEERLANG
jgi:hypothetical protein